MSNIEPIHRFGNPYMGAGGYVRQCETSHDGYHCGFTQVMIDGDDHRRYVDDALPAYVDALLWVSVDDDGEPLDARFDADALEPELVERMRQRLYGFVAALSDDDLLDMTDPAQVGHDFALTTQRTGAGFTDGDWGDLGETFYAIAQRWYALEVYVTVNGTVDAL